MHNIVPPFPRSFKGKFHILFSHARQLHLTRYLLRSSTPKYDAYFVDQLSTCVPFLRAFARTRVVFYCHFPDKLLANGEYVEGNLKQKGGLLKALYRLPMDWLEEVTTRKCFLLLQACFVNFIAASGQADIILANSKFTARVFKTYFTSIHYTPQVIYPGINLSAYETGAIDHEDPDVIQVTSYVPLTFERYYPLTWRKE